ncbi:MAG: energy transducer TonB [Candidatus Omnitrophota bacterium]|nr:MAG: energy transducer TonB [Candidatus Omnitrophota bacterium]
MTFPKALLISFLWHMFCLFAVIIVISPVSAGKEKFSKINFIGAILDKDTFGYYKQKKGFSYADEKHPVKKLSEENNAATPFAEGRLRFAKSGPYIDRPYANSITEIIKERKVSPPDAPLPIEKISSAYSSEVKSEAAGRQVLFKPTPPTISRTFQVGKTPFKGESFEIKLRFLVSPQGKVVFIEKMKSCGYPDVDLIAVRYIKKWQFAPLSPEKLKKNQEGIMLLQLEAQ